MRLLLDEMYSPVIADQLRERGHDVRSLHDLDLTGANDRAVLKTAGRERRALVTENVADFIPLLREVTAAGGDAGFGTVFTSPRSLPRSTATIGAFVEALSRLCDEVPDEEGLAGQVLWLQPTPDQA